MQDFKNLRARQEARRLVVSVYRQTARLPHEERYGLQAQLRRAAMSVAANLAEGAGRGSDADFARFASMAMGSASELECYLTLAEDLGLLDAATLAGQRRQVGVVKRMLAGLIRKLRE